MSSLNVPGPSAGDDSDPEVPSVRRSGGSSARNRPGVGAAPTLLLDYPRRQRSYFTAADERVLRHNYDIPPSIFLHFPDTSTGMIDGSGDLCVYERMFLAGLRLPFPQIVRELLSSLGIAPAQLMPNGWRYFFSTYLLWPIVFQGETMSIPEFLNIYGPHMYPTNGLVTFMVRGKNQFIELESTYSNNKCWGEQFFYISGNWEAADSEACPLRHSIPRKWGVSRESCKYSLLTGRYRVAFPHLPIFICRE